ncbi:glycosyltransferase family 4 protein [Ferdinandcohnia sp. SAFN-114]|uniref:glycosyltransferase family 4 protein n=1 Tax=Ferdinandcohnia sp. SAFN-114 TaxID=3387275 RepID=UPI003F81D5D5
MEKIKLVFAGHDLKFASLIIGYLESTGMYEIRLDNWKGHNVHDEQHSQSCLEWADIIVCEWGLGNAVWYSNRKLPNQKIVVRMHLQEVNTPYPRQFDMKNIDKIIAISPYVYEEFYRVFKLPREKMTMIYNVVDTDKMDLPKEDYKYHLGFIGLSPKRKRLDLAVDILGKLWEKDSRYKLFIKGKLPQEYPWLWNREEEREYYEELFSRIENAPWKNAVIFDGFGSDINVWLKKIGYVLSTSDFESFHLSPSEGMASGAYPLILKWDGSNTIYSEEYLFNNVDECVNKVIEINNLESDQVLRNKAKEYVQKNFSVERIGSQWNSLINHLLSS